MVKMQLELRPCDEKHGKIKVSLVRTMAGARNKAE